MRLINTKIGYLIGGSPRHSVMHFSDRTVGGINSLPPWSKMGITFGEWRKKYPKGTTNKLSNV